MLFYGRGWRTLSFWHRQVEEVVKGWWKNNFQHLYPLQLSEGSNKWTQSDASVGFADEGNIVFVTRGL